MTEIDQMFADDEVENGLAWVRSAMRCQRRGNTFQAMRRHHVSFFCAMHVLALEAL